jgi:hypothetical protein
MVMTRSFDDWWNTIPSDLKEKAREGDETNKPLLNQINYTLLQLDLGGEVNKTTTMDTEADIERAAEKKMEDTRNLSLRH